MKSDSWLRLTQQRSFDLVLGSTIEPEQGESRKATYSFCGAQFWVDSPQCQPADTICIARLDQYDCNSLLDFAAELVFC